MGTTRRCLIALILGLVLSPIAGADTSNHEAKRRSGSPGKAARRVALPELDSYLSKLPTAWRKRAKRIIERCETQSRYQIRVLELSYLPVVGTAETGLFLIRS